MELKHHDEIMRAISSKVTSKCPMCGCSKFELDGLEYHHTSFPLNDPAFLKGDFSKVKSIPCVSAICKNCGFIASFSLPTIIKDYRQG